ncbi:MAG: hypothetical protein QNK37_28110 [Acidobacteriota bacterium]|nr:hypothetical protein [Acidobacteriota bacterium]
MIDLEHPSLQKISHLTTHTGNQTSGFMRMEKVCDVRDDSHFWRRRITSRTGNLMDLRIEIGYRPTALLQDVTFGHEKYHGISFFVGAAACSA